MRKPETNKSTTATNYHEEARRIAGNHEYCRAVWGVEYMCECGYEERVFKIADALLAASK